MACLTQKVALLLVTMQHDLLSKARKSRDDNIVKVWEWKDFVPALQKGHMVLTPFCNETEFEELVKDKSKAEALAASGEEEDEKCSSPEPSPEPEPVTQEHPHPLNLTSPEPAARCATPVAASGVRPTCAVSTPIWRKLSR